MTRETRPIVKARTRQKANRTAHVDSRNRNLGPRVRALARDDDDDVVLRVFDASVAGRDGGWGGDGGDRWTTGEDDDADETRGALGGASSAVRRATHRARKRG